MPDPDLLTLVADRLAISDLVHAYAQGVDRRDPDAVARLFTEDGIFVAYATPGAAEPTSRSEGRAAIAKAIGTARYYRQTTHTIGNHLATVARRPRHGRDPLRRLPRPRRRGHRDPHGVAPPLSRCVRAPGPDGWRIHERVLRVDLVSDQPLGAG